MSPQDVSRPRAQARDFLRSAREFGAVAKDSFASRRYRAVVSNAALAAVNASDAICVATMGLHSTSPNHNHAVNMLRQAGPLGVQAVEPFERLMRKKNPAQYQPDSVGRTDAQQALDDAEILVRLAVQAVALLPAPPKATKRRA